MTNEEAGLATTAGMRPCEVCNKKSDGAKRVQLTSTIRIDLCGTCYDAWKKSAEAHGPAQRPVGSRFMDFMTRRQGERRNGVTP